MYKFAHEMIRDTMSSFLINRLEIAIIKYKGFRDEFVFVSMCHNNLVRENNDIVDAIRTVESKESRLYTKMLPPMHVQKLSLLETDYSAASFLVNMKPLLPIPSVPSTRTGALKYQSRVLQQMRRYKSEAAMLTRRLNHAKRARAQAAKHSLNSDDAFAIVSNRYILALGPKPIS